MPTYDPNRAAFISQAYRVHTQSDAAVLARVKNASAIKIDTQLTAADAATIAAKMLTEGKKNALGFRIEMEGTIMPSSLKNNVPIFNLLSALYNLTDGARIFRLVAVECDDQANRSILTVRG